jgi:dCMP deaminase
MTRVSWDRYFMNLAIQAATRSTCPRKHVGAVVVRDRTVLSTGYNGSMRGSEHCTDAGCLMENDHCVRTVHAEANAIAQAARHGIRLDGAQIYVTASPCFNCFKLIANSGIDGRRLRRVLPRRPGDAVRRGAGRRRWSTSAWEIRRPMTLRARNWTSTRSSVPLSWPEIFGRSAPLHLEIGSGKGRFLLELAAAHPEWDLLAVERANKYHTLVCSPRSRGGA